MVQNISNACFCPGSNPLFGAQGVQGQQGTLESVSDTLLIFSSSPHAARLKSSSIAYSSDTLLENQ